MSLYIFVNGKGLNVVSAHMRVSILHLENQTWGGTLERALGNLTFLTILKLSNIGLHGEIPKQAGCLKRLKDSMSKITY